MTFRPSDDVLDELTNGQQPSQSVDQYNVSNQEDWQHMFINPEDYDINWVVENNETNPIMIDVPTEEVKAPDLSELLKVSWEGENSENVVTGINEWNDNSWYQQVENVENIVVENSEVEESTNVVNATDNASALDENKNEWLQVQNVENKEVQMQNDESQSAEISLKHQAEEDEYITPGKLPDVERWAIVSWLEGSINSNLDFLVDNNRLSIVKNYKILTKGIGKEKNWL